MSTLYLLVAILMPLIGSLFVIQIKDRKKLHQVTMAIVTLTSVVLWAVILAKPQDTLVLLSFTDRLQFALNHDALGRFFAGIIATLWPFTTLYAFEYLGHDKRPASFFMFFLMAYSVTIGVTASANFFTLYAFYELLTLTTLPLVMHTRTVEAIRAARIYLALSIGGAAFAFMSMMYVIMNEGVLERTWVTQLFYVFGFFGFSVKAAVFPLHAWLPRASAAPMPVTALLHAVAVVKSGVFAIIRLTYFAYGTEVLVGSFAQYIPMVFVIWTIYYGASIAVREIHLKRRLAYSTVANLSYILFGVLLMTNEGLTAALLHMAFHAEIKILGFFAVGAIMHTNEVNYIYEIDGLAKKMPYTWACFTVSALALVGIPPLSGFVSKFSLLVAGAKAGTVWGYTGSFVLLISALLTAIYSLTPVRRAYFPDKDADLEKLGQYKEAGWMMVVPMVLLAVGILITGLNAGVVENAANAIACTLMKW